MSPNIAKCPDGEPQSQRQIEPRSMSGLFFPVSYLPHIDFLPANETDYMQFVLCFPHSILCSQHFPKSLFPSIECALPAAGWHWRAGCLVPQPHPSRALELDSYGAQRCRAAHTAGVNASHINQNPESIPTTGWTQEGGSWVRGLMLTSADGF